MEKPSKNIDRLERGTDKPFISINHLSNSYTVYLQPKRVVHDTPTSYRRIDVYNDQGENCGYFLGDWTHQRHKSPVFTAEQSRSFVDSYSDPKYRALLRNVVLAIILQGVTWRSDRLEMLSGEGEGEGWEDNPRRNAQHMYRSLNRLSTQPNSPITRVIENERYVFRRK